MKNINTPNINLPQQYINWFNNIYRGTTSYGNVYLYAYNENYSLIKVYNPGYYSRMIGHVTSGLTEWFIVQNLCELNKSYGTFEKQTILWTIEGRLLKKYKNEIYNKFNLNYKLLYKQPI